MAEKEFEPDDPMELMGVETPGSLDEMAQCLVEEYIRDGWDDESLIRLFSDPFYRATHHIYQVKGEGYVRDLITRMREKWGHCWQKDDISLRLRMDEVKKWII